MPPSLRRLYLFPHLEDVMCEEKIDGFELHFLLPCNTKHVHEYNRRSDDLESSFSILCSLQAVPGVVSGAATRIPPISMLERLSGPYVSNNPSAEAGWDFHQVSRPGSQAAAG